MSARWKREREKRRKTKLNIKWKCSDQNSAHLEHVYFQKNYKKINSYVLCITMILVDFNLHNYRKTSNTHNSLSLRLFEIIN